jgi:hypothetical protein
MVESVDNTYDVTAIRKYYDVWKKYGWTGETAEQKRMHVLMWTYCPDGIEHDFRVVHDESYMCDTLYKCIRCGHKKRVDSSD